MQRSMTGRPNAKSALQAEYSGQEIASTHSFRVQHSLPCITPLHHQSSGLPALFVFRISPHFNGLASSGAATFSAEPEPGGPWYETTLLARDDVREPLHGVVRTITNTVQLVLHRSPPERLPRNARNRAHIRKRRSTSRLRDSTRAHAVLLAPTVHDCEQPRQISIDASRQIKIYTPS